jgi:hypothetical protein
MVFVADTHCSTFIRQNTRADKRAASQPTNKNPRQKNYLKLNNIMCVIVFFSLAYVRQNTGAEHALKKSYNNIILNSQHRIAIKKINPPQAAILLFFLLHP